MRLAGESRRSTQFRLALDRTSQAKYPRPFPILDVSARHEVVPFTGAIRIRIPHVQEQAPFERDAAFSKLREGPSRAQPDDALCQHVVEVHADRIWPGRRPPARLLHQRILPDARRVVSRSVSALMRSRAKMGG